MRINYEYVILYINNKSIAFFSQKIFGFSAKWSEI